MKKIIPILTEKSMLMAKKGLYSFWVLPNVDKFEARKIISETFGVTVKKVRTGNKKGLVKRNTRGHFVTKVARKKVMVELGEKEKIDIFKE